MKLISVKLDKSRTIDLKENRDSFIKISVSMDFDMTDHDTSIKTLEDCYEFIGKQVSTLMNSEAKKLYNKLKK